jgi:hypothetical protein
MSLFGLVVRQKLSYLVTGQDITIPFTMLGLQSDPIEFLGVLLRTTGNFTLRVKDSLDNTIFEKSDQGSGNYEVVLLGGNLNLTCPNIYRLEAVCDSPLGIYEMNLATLCLCEGLI